MIVASSILSLDYTDTKSQLATLEKSNSEWIHFDVMDGHFVPNISFGPDILKAFKKASTRFMDVHIMVSDPKKYSEVFIKAGADGLTFHYEALNEDEIIPLCEKIKAMGARPGISIKPGTPAEKLLPYLPYVNLVLVMSVEPGFGGQKFMESSLAKIRMLKDKILKNGYDCKVEVDGGINEVTGKLCAEAGVDVLVAGSYIFKNDIIRAVDTLCAL